MDGAGRALSVGKVSLEAGMRSRHPGGTRPGGVGISVFCPLKDG